MIKYVGNTNAIINWDQVIAGLEKCGHETHPGPFYGPKHKAGDPIPQLKEVTDIWTDAGYHRVEDGGTVQWDMFFPGTHFDQSIVDKFVEHYNIEKYSSVWISRIWPGHFAPIHWDVNDMEEELAKYPDRLRWHCHIGKPTFGHVLIVEDQVFYNQQQGDVFQWDSRKYWHAGTNCGLTPKYLFNIW